MLGASDTSPEKLAVLRHQLGLDQPLVAQYGDWIWRVLHGDFGTSAWTGMPVIDEIGGRVGVTVELTVLGLLVAVVLAIPAGCLMAAMRSSASDYAVRILSIAGVTVPSFWLGSLLLYGAGTFAPGVPLIGWVPFADAPLANLQRIILPVAAIALPVVATLARVVRAAMVEALGQDYVRTARAKGAGDVRVVRGHVLRNVLPSFMTMLGMNMGIALGGVIFVESAFGLPGLGGMLRRSILQHDLPLTAGIVVFLALAIMLLNLIVDLAYAAFDPRVRLPRLSLQRA
jgi:peptide/nickel transport system permease protein